MRRFFFGLQGGHNVDDRHGLPFATPLDAYRAAERLANELSATRPQLRDNTCVVVTAQNAEEVCVISVCPRQKPAELAAMSSARQPAMRDS